MSEKKDPIPANTYNSIKGVYNVNCKRSHFFSGHNKHHQAADLTDATSIPWGVESLFSSFLAARPLAEKRQQAD